MAGKKTRNEHTITDLYQMQAVPLNVKVRMTEKRIRDWVYEYGINGVYISFSGGKDSTVLLDIARNIFPEMKAVFIDTGLEYPEIRQFVKQFDNVDWIRPELTFKQVLEKYGYPFISKEVSECVDGARKYLTYIAERESLGKTAPYVQAYRKISGTGEYCKDSASTQTQQGGGYNDNLEGLANVLSEDLGKVRATGSPYRLAQLLGILGKENQIKENISSKDRSRYSCERYKFLLNCPANISAKCCVVMKKAPAHKYTKETGRMPITAQMASESRLRTQQWLKNGCNGFNMKSPISNPMAFWTEQDVLLYIREKGIPICSVYGDIVTENEENGQLTIADVFDTGIFDSDRPILHTTGCERTGCMFCGYGCHLENSPNRFERMKETHPNQYDYIMRGGAYEYTIRDKNGTEIKLRHCMEKQIEKWVSDNDDNENFSITAIWKPDNRGLGYKFLINWLNENGNLNIRY